MRKMTEDKEKSRFVLIDGWLYVPREEYKKYYNIQD